MEDEWKTFKRVEETEMMKPVSTAVAKKDLDQVAEAISKLPGDQKFLRKI